MHIQHLRLPWNIYRKLACTHLISCKLRNTYGTWSGQLASYIARIRTQPSKLRNGHSIGIGIYKINFEQVYISISALSVRDRINTEVGWWTQPKFSLSFYIRIKNRYNLRNPFDSSHHNHLEINYVIESWRIRGRFFMINKYLFNQLIK